MCARRWSSAPRSAVGVHHDEVACGDGTGVDTMVRVFDAEQGPVSGQMIVCPAWMWIGAGCRALTRDTSWESWTNAISTPVCRSRWCDVARSWHSRSPRSRRGPRHSPRVRRAVRGVASGPDQHEVLVDQQRTAGVNHVCVELRRARPAVSSTQTWLIGHGGLPIRMRVWSSSQTVVATTRSSESDRHRMSRSIWVRSLGSAWPKSRSESNFASLRSSFHRGW